MTPRFVRPGGAPARPSLPRRVSGASGQIGTMAGWTVGSGFKVQGCAAEACSGRGNEKSGGWVMIIGQKGRMIKSSS